MEESLVERLAHMINVHANAKQVYGDPIERDGVTIIPVAKVQWGFGGGGLGAGVLERSGAGGGVRATPAGFIEIRGGDVQFVPFRDASDVGILLGAALAGIAIGMIVAKR